VLDRPDCCAAIQRDLNRQKWAQEFQGVSQEETLNPEGGEE